MVSGGPLFFDDLAVGQRWSTGRRTVTETDIVQFAGVSGDFNPLHSDAVFAADTAFGRTIAHGALVLAIVTGLRQQTGLFSGTLKALLEIRSWRFERPVFPGDTIYAVTTIRELRRSSSGQQGVVVQGVEVINHREEIVQEGELVALMRMRP
jgi:acyl dehydratase